MDNQELTDSDHETIIDLKLLFFKRKLYYIEIYDRCLLKKAKIIVLHDCSGMQLKRSSLLLFRSVKLSFLNILKIYKNMSIFGKTNILNAVNS